MQFNRGARIAAALVLAGSIGLAACGDDDDQPGTSGEPTTTTTEEPTTTSGDGDTIEVTGVEYAFEDLPGEVEAGTTLTFTNGGAEAHEMVVVAIPSGETRSIEELLALPEEEAEKATLFQGVAIAAPGEDGEVVEGDLTLEEPGRYVALCFIPVGTTELSEGPPEEGEEQGGPPHFTQGMVQEFTVE